MDVITEGVETQQQQLQALSEMGCNHFQGYYFSRPVPVKEFEARFSSPAQTPGASEQKKKDCRKK